MKKYIKLFLLLFTFTASHTIVIATELVDNTAMEIKVKTNSADSEENSKDFKLDLFISHRIICTILPAMKLNLSASVMHSNIYLESPFKPPRA